MSGKMAAVGVGGYALAAFIMIDAPTVTQEVVGVLVATNATLFVVGAMIVGELRKARAPSGSGSSAPTPVASLAPRDEYARWAESLTRTKS